MEHLLQMSKCSIFHNIFKYMIFQRHQKVIMECSLFIKNCHWFSNPRINTDVAGWHHHLSPDFFQITFIRTKNLQTTSPELQGQKDSE